MDTPADVWQFEKQNDRIISVLSVLQVLIIYNYNHMSVVQVLIVYSYSHISVLQQVLIVYSYM